MRRWKMLFYEGDVLKVEQLDGPSPTQKGEAVELIVVEERTVRGRQGGSAPSTVPGSGGGPAAPGDGDADEVPASGAVNANAADPDREPIVV